ncbi:MAG: nuclear transport factor 2 family protein [Planctomycetota bacterium]
MKETLTFVFSILLFTSLSWGQDAPESRNQTLVDSEVVKPVLQQLNAYNARDIDAFLAAYSNDVRVYSYPETLRYQGIEKMRERYTKFFEGLDRLNCEIVSRMVMGNVVIDQERVTTSAAGVDSVIEAIAIYTIEKGKIVAVRFVQK